MTTPHGRRLVVPAKTDIRTAGAVASVVSFVTWLLGRYIFDGSVPPEVTGIVLLTVPYLLAMLSAHAVRRRQVRAAETAAYIRSLKDLPPRNGA
jgi:hypothetical protein